MKKICTMLACILTGVIASANNIQVSNINVSQPNISFMVTWDNSWNTMSNINSLYPNNWDGAWVFIKYQNNIDNLWKHATVSSVGGDHSITGGVLQIDAVSDGMGFYPQDKSRVRYCYGNGYFKNEFPRGGRYF